MNSDDTRADDADNESGVNRASGWSAPLSSDDASDRPSQPVTGSTSRPTPARDAVSPAPAPWERANGPSSGWSVRPDGRDNGRDDAPSGRDSGPAPRGSGTAPRDVGPASRNVGPTQRDSGYVPRDSGLAPRTAGPAARDGGRGPGEGGPAQRSTPSDQPGNGPGQRGANSTFAGNRPPPPRPATGNGPAPSQGNGPLPPKTGPRPGWQVGAPPQRPAGPGAQPGPATGQTSGRPPGQGSVPPQRTGAPMPPGRRAPIGAPGGPPPRAGDPSGRAGTTPPPTENLSGTSEYARAGERVFVPPRRDVAASAPAHDARPVGPDEGSGTQAYSAVNEPSNRKGIGSRVEDQEEPVAPPRTAAPASSSTTTMNRTAIWAFVLSLLGITSPVGIYLGYRARDEIRSRRQYGAPFATVAIRLGWTWVAVAVVAVLVYLFIFVF